VPERVGPRLKLHEKDAPLCKRRALTPTSIRFHVVESSDREALSYAGRIRPDRGGVAPPAQIIKKNAAAALCLCRQNVALRVPLGQFGAKPASPRAGTGQPLFQ